MMYTEVDRRNDFHWFLNNYENLYDKYGHKFFAIQNKVILGIYNELREALDETSKKYPLGTFCVQECNGDKSAYTASIVTIGIIG